MALDAKKLKSYLTTVEPGTGRRGTAPDEEPLPKTARPFLKPGQDPAALLDRLERGDETDLAQLGRLLSPKVSYMELPEKAGAFSCGACGFRAAGDMCRNPAVLAPVSAQHGCCDLFWPSHGEPSFPPAADEG